MKTCPLCQRPLGQLVEGHHLIPRLKGGRAEHLVDLHSICHRKIHSVFSENELAHYYNTIERLLEHEEIKRFAHWVSKKHPDYHDSSRLNNRRR
jgi:hypothetical protein